jgi:hypothetical protein
MSLSITVATSMTAIMINKQKTIRAATKSAQSYYTAEAGIEDALLRITNPEITNPPSSYTITINGTGAQINIAENNGSRTVQSQGNVDNRQRSVEANVRINTEEASFHFGVQATAGGVVMGNGSTINGNIYSNGSILGSNGALISGDAIVAGAGDSGNKIDNVKIERNAFAPNLSNCTVTGDATYLVGGSISKCTVTGSKIVQNNPIENEEMPITQTIIDNWKAEAENGGIIASGDYSPSPGTHIIGPGIINGNMILGNNQTIILTGTVYVHGYIDIQNGAGISLSSDYGSASGILLADNWIEIKNNGIFGGSGQAGSYLMIMSLSACNGSSSTNCSSGKAAMEIHNNAEGVIFYAANGLLSLHNGVRLTQATGWKIYLDNNAIVNYELGLESALFSSGPGASYAIDGWKEVE